MGRGMYPSQSIEATVVPAGMFSKWRAEVIWYREPTPVGATDLALEGGDDAMYALGKFGLASGVRYPPSLKHPDGETVMFKDKLQQKIVPRWCLEATQLFALPKAETRGMTDNIIATNRKAGVTGQYYACDRTGHGAGVADLLKDEWSNQIHDVNYSESAAENDKEKMMSEDTKSISEEYERMFSVLWFAMKKWGEFQYFFIHPSMDISKVMIQVTSRRFRTSAGKQKVESKRDYESRGFQSPNEADALTLLVHAARKGSGLTLSMRGNPVDVPRGLDDTDDWPVPGTENGVRVDSSNTTDYLDTSDRAPIDVANPIL